MRYYIGIDIGGTKIATIIATEDFKLIDRVEFPTKNIKNPIDTIHFIMKNIDTQLENNEINIDEIISFGISCGGPLNSKKGIILSPPNLKNWDNIKVVNLFKDRYNKPTYLQNDANACALAEWKVGAGKGFKNMIFLTFGTGMGAGLILNEKLYSGTNDMAGEVGHIRIAEDGPIGYGKHGSFEGYCSGGGIARLGRALLLKEENYNGLLDKDMSTKDIAIEARKGDLFAYKILELSAQNLGRGLSILIDILNPEAIIIGSIFTRCEDILREPMEKILKEETLKYSLNRCKILKAELGESIGDYGAIITATGQY